MKKIWTAWDAFWFGSVPLLNLALFRILLCGTMFAMAVSRQFDVSTFYTDQGLLPRKWAIEVMPEFFKPPFDWILWSDAGATTAHAAMTLGLLLLVLGIGGRGIALAVWILHMGFLQRNYSIAFGADLIGGIFLFLMIGTDSCARLSLASRFRKGKASPETSTDLLTPVFFRMIQLQLCVIYAYTGFEKLKGGTWWDGTALWSVFANSQMVILDLTWMRSFPLAIVAMTYVTVLFEIYFPVLVWVRKTRPWVLALGASFHLGVGLLMALMNFGLVMMSAYFLFLKPETLQAALGRLRGSRSRNQGSTS